jgi:hypothetical protein
LKRAFSYQRSPIFQLTNKKILKLFFQALLLGLFEVSEDFEFDGPEKFFFSLS